jgi:hypothetical protein
VNVYLDNLKWQELLSTVPTVMHGKKIADLERAWEREYKIRCLNSAPLILTVDVTQSSRQGIVEFLESCGAALVDVMPSDIRVLLGGQRNPAIMALVHGAHESPALQQQLCQLEPTEIFSTLDRLLWTFVAPGEVQPLNAIDEAIAVQRMRDAGIEVPDVAFDAVPLSEHQQRAAEMPLEPGDLGEDVSTDDLISAVERAGLEEYL